MVISSQYGDWIVMKKEFFKDFLDGVVIFLLVRGGIFEWVFYNGNMGGFLLKVI